MDSKTSFCIVLRSECLNQAIGEIVGGSGAVVAKRSKPNDNRVKTIKAGLFLRFSFVCVFKLVRQRFSNISSLSASGYHYHVTSIESQTIQLKMLARHIIVLLPLVAATLASPLIIETRSGELEFSHRSRHISILKIHPDILIDPNVHGALSLRGSHEDAAQQGHAKRDDEDAAERGYTKRGDDEDAVNVYHKRAEDEDSAEKGYSKRGDGE